MPYIDYAYEDGAVPGYLAVPSGQGPWPAVVVLHDALGLTDDITRISDRFADNGYLALAPALYRRGNRARCVVSTFRAQLAGDGSAIRAILAARDHLVGDSRCTGKVGSIGFCLGGGFCLQLAPSRAFDAAAPNYGVLPPAMMPDLSGACPMVASYGARDLMLRGAAARLEAELSRDGIAHDVKEYAGVGHGFMNDWSWHPALQFVERIGRLEYSEPEAEDAWRRILAFFQRHLSSES